MKKPSKERMEKSLAPYFTLRNGRRCIEQGQVENAIDVIMKEYGKVFCEVSPSKTYGVVTFKVSSARIIYFEAEVIS